jgi:leucyl aminopeptidase
MIPAEIVAAEAARVEADLVAVPVFEEDLGKGGRIAELDRALDGHLAAAVKEERFRAKPESTLLLATVGRLPSKRVLLVGLGPKSGAARIAASGYEALRVAAGAAARGARKAGAAKLALALAPPFDAPGAVRAAVEGALLGAYRFDRFKSKQDGEAKAPARLAIALPAGAAGARVAKESVRLGRAIGEAVAWARDLVNEPPMVCTPARLAKAAEEVAKDRGLTVEVQGPRDIAKLGMGMFQGVARGSSEEPRLVRVSYTPKKGVKGKPVVLVGKAITFDSGGLSLKPTDSMVTMNSDMAGSAAVLATMRVVAELAPQFPVHAVLGACENMPGGRAYKPSDILTAFNGKTVEITNTDAEGRLVLGDVLAWAVKTFEPAAIVDVATLTGACVVALGHTTSGVFGPDGKVVDGVLAAARAAGEDFWRLPMTESVKENLKSEVADLKNAGERWGGAISAAWFLREFVGETPWAHLDIAGPAHSGKERGYVAKGGTGVAVRTLVEFVSAWRG